MEYLNSLIVQLIRQLYVVYDQQRVNGVCVMYVFGKLLSVYLCWSLLSYEITPTLTCELKHVPCA